MSEPCRVPLLVALSVVVQCALKIVDGEEEFLGGPLVEGAEDAVVADERLESAAERVALNPVYSVVLVPLTTSQNR